MQPGLARASWMGVLIPLLLIAAALRVAMAQGGLWLDEAWSVAYVSGLSSPVGVFTAIHHDNNHHLNSLWLWLVGMEAHSVVQRLLSIVAGVASILLAAMLGYRRSPAAGLATAVMLAVSPIFMIYGAEARGYAPMVALLLFALLLVDRWLVRPDPSSRWWLGLCFGVAATAQLTALFGLIAVAGWVLWEQRRRLPLRQAIVTTINLLMPAIIAVTSMIMTTFLLPRWQGLPFRVGGVAPFDLESLARGLTMLVTHLCGADRLGFGLVAMILLLSLVAAFALRLQSRALYLSALIGLPLLVTVARLGNAGHARYYLVIGVALVLLWGDLFGRLWAAGRASRSIAAAGLMLFVGLSLHADIRLIDDARGQPDRPVALMRRLSPSGATLLILPWRSKAVHEAEARRHGYRLQVQAAGCPATDFLLVSRFNGRPFGDLGRHCGYRWQALDQDRPIGLSTDGWRLYRRLPG